MPTTPLRLAGSAVSLALAVTLIAPCTPIAEALPVASEPFLVEDLNQVPAAGSSPCWLTAAQSRLFFVADDGLHGRQLWASPGSPASALRLTGIEIDPYLERIWVGSAGGRLFASLDRDLWVSDGSPAGTRRLVGPGEVSSRAGFGVLGSKLYFSRGARLWVSDGSPEGTGPVGAGEVATGGIHPIHEDPPAFGAVAGGRLFFRGADDESLWATDGTVEGTSEVAEVSWPEGFVSAGVRVYFRGGWTSSDRELWSSDGTADGTGPVTDDPADPLGAIGSQALYSRAVAGAWELRSIGATSGTDLLLARFLEPPGSLVPLAAEAVFAATDTSAGRELWRTDGTPAGTRRVADLRPGPAGSAPFALTVAPGRVLFFADDGTTGFEPWESDGTSAGTRRLADLAPGPTSSAPIFFTCGMIAALGDLVMFQADDGARGRELWAVAPAGAGGTCVADAETLCFEQGRFAVRVAWFDPRSGDSGAGRAVSGPGRSGTFWFFRPDNTELTVKLLDGRRVNGHFWFFYGALTDVEYDLAVIDTVADRERSYHNPAGWICGDGDTIAFPAP